ncbi:hypothetical protein E2C01_093307 [Portunus trituberculatus]|uniref:Uncharacterized protein n=1 Tax=Portunus trituberculatus TaxID=210409 RepID=A0A5B7JME2_PORTR|nr:hypothetical protein [Portunus trituberculatus]
MSGKVRVLTQFSTNLVRRRESQLVQCVRGENVDAFVAATQECKSLFCTDLQQRSFA